MKAKPYPKYKPSGIEWLGDLPGHWDFKRLRFVSSMKKGRLPTETISSPSSDADVPYLSMEFLRGETDQPNYVASSQGLVRAEPNDVLLLWDGSNAGEFLKAKRGVVSSTISKVNPIGVDRAYLFYSCKALEPQVKELTVGMGIPHVSGDELKSCSIPYPNLTEQRSIAAFLDLETGRIDDLIAKKKLLIERLKEKRTALISRTVTRGLPPEAAAKLGLPVKPSLKPSGLDWLGDIPKHWELKKFRRIIERLDQGWSPNAHNSPAPDWDLGVLKLGAASKGRFYPQENKALEEIPEGASPITPRHGDLLISRANTPDLVGDACVVKGNFPNRIIPDLIYRLRLSPEVNTDFICWFILSTAGRAQIESDARGSSGSMVKLGQGHVRSWLVPSPPLSEQSAIAAYLDMETAKLDALVGKVMQAIERLQEYRTALITATVTGKIDVRKF